MGMFDEVVARCSCGGDALFQSKAGDCELNVYQTNSVPLDIAASVDGEYSTCESCGRSVSLHLPFGDRVPIMEKWHEKD